MKKIISLVLSVMMILSIASISSFAAKEVKDGDILYKQDFDTVTNFETTGFTLWETGAYNNTKDCDFRFIKNTANGNRSMMISQPNASAPTQIKIADKAVFDSVKDGVYTIQYTLNPYVNVDTTKEPNKPTEWIGEISVRFGDLDPDSLIRLGEKDDCSGSAVWLKIDGNNLHLLRNYPFESPKGGVGNEYKVASGKGDHTKLMNCSVRYAIEVNTTTDSVTVYINGEKVSSRNNAKFTASNGLFLEFAHANFAIDDIYVSAGGYASAPAKQATQPKIEFDAADSGATWPEKDYSGVKRGQTIFAEDFKRANNVADLGWGTLNNRTFGAKNVSATVDTKNHEAKLEGTTGSFGAVEVIPKAAVESYGIYTMHFKVRLERNDDRLAIFFNAKDAGSTANCGFFEIRKLSPIGLRNSVINNGKQVGDTKPSSLVGGSDFVLSLEINNELNLVTCFVDGQYFSGQVGLPDFDSAVYFVTCNCSAVVSDIKVTSGSMNDYQLVLEGKDPYETEAEDTTEEDTEIVNPDDQTEPETEITAAPATKKPEATTEAEKKSGCGSSIFANSAVVMLVVTSVALTGLAVHKKKER